MNILAFFETGDVSEPRWRWVQRCWAAFGLLLLLVTWRLWIPQSVFPQVPLLRLMDYLPAACQWALIVIVVAALVTGVGLLRQLNELGRACLFLTFAVAMILLIVIDQHRLQPWAYQSVIYAVVFATIPDGAVNRLRGIALLRMLTISVYLFSALGKLDFQFLDTVGQQFLETALGFIGIGIQQWQGPVRTFLPLVFPLAELLIVVALAVPGLRRMGVAAAVALHVMLLLVLGPWGLQHQPGVLVWNLFFIAQVLLLFSDPRQHAAAPDAPGSRERTERRWTPAVVVLAVVGFPLFEPLGWCDHWPAWGLYSPRNSRAIVEIHQAGLQQLPAGLRPYLANADDGESWVRLNIDDWSLDALSVPIYPQDRFQLGVAESIATRYGLERTIRVHLLGMSNRWSGTRPAKTLIGRHQLVAAGTQFRLNSHPATRD